MTTKSLTHPPVKTTPKGEPNDLDKDPNEIDIDGPGVIDGRFIGRSQKCCACLRLPDFNEENKVISS